MSEPVVRLGGVTVRDRILRERAAIRVQFGTLFDNVSAALFRDDPVGINFETNTDEYEPEVGSILPRLKGCASEGDVARVVHEEFVRWSGADAAGHVERYVSVASEIWQLWLRHAQH